jgi:hypothetical protein
VKSKNAIKIRKKKVSSKIYIPKDQDKASTHSTHTGRALSFSFLNIFCGLIILQEQKHLHVNLDLSLVLVNGAVMDRCGYSQSDIVLVHFL